jgi:hypothetical protein
MLLMIMLRMGVFVLTMLARMIVTAGAHVPAVHIIMGVFVSVFMSVFMIMGMSMDSAVMQMFMLVLMFVLMRVPM